jgi:hypothetical protein
MASGTSITDHGLLSPRQRAATGGNALQERGESPDPDIQETHAQNHKDLPA